MARIRLPVCVALAAVLSGCGGSEFSANGPHGSGGNAGATAGSGGNSSGGGSGDGGAGGGSSGGTAGVGASGGSAGSGGGGIGGSVSSGGGTGGVNGDGGPLSDAACTNITWFLDADGDGHGGPDQATGCAPPDAGVWVTSSDDCDDGNASVHPGQLGYFVDGYVPTGTTTLSFDYDCSGKEEETGSIAKLACKIVNLSCVGSGYLKAQPIRTGSGVDPYCGSDQSASCVGLTCYAGSPFSAPKVACH